jgi:hypothetical protein
MYENPAKHCDYIHKLNTTTPCDFFKNGIIGDTELDIFSNKEQNTMESIKEGSQEEMEQNNEIDFDSI